jgi:hypothetical protein
MTAARPQRKTGNLLGLAIVASLMLPASALGQTTERVMADWRTGIALSGFDPVAYFTDAAPKKGRPDYEYSFAGVTWRFRNEGNRAAFKDHPDIYMPRFGGHDPVAVGRGVARPGHPEMWLIAEQRLYLFYSAEARDAFQADPGQSQDAAEEKWPEVARTLAR